MACTLLGLALLPALAGCGSGVSLIDYAPEPTAADRVRLARRLLEDARKLEREERFEAALRNARRGLAWVPDQPDLLRLEQRLLARTGRTAEAEAAAERLRADGRLPELRPAEALATPQPAETLDIVLAPHPGSDEVEAERVPRSWDDGPALATVRRRIDERLPGARVLRARDDVLVSVPAARTWLHERTVDGALLVVRAERAFCASTVKDGPFALVRLSAASSDGPRASARPLPPQQTVLPIDDPESADCYRLALVESLDRLLAAWAERLGAGSLAIPEADLAYPAATLRALFPLLDRRIVEAREPGRRLLAAGQLEAARDALAEALALDPDDRRTASLLAEATRSLEIEAALLAKRERARDEPEEIVESSRAAPRLTRSERATLEAELAREQALRAEVLAALSLLDASADIPGPETLDRLQPARLPEDGDPGLALARRGRTTAEDASSALESRVLFAPSGDVLARFYFEPGAGEPLLAEEDGDGDGEPDRWTRYQEGHRREVWERGGEADRPDVHLVYEAGGEALTRVELDADRNGRPERAFEYVQGRLARESHDDDGDGILDATLHFDADGQVALREEDLDDDGEIDVRTAYRSGRLVRREILNPDRLPADLVP